jgi:hypothetical protein
MGRRGFRRCRMAARAVHCLDLGDLRWREHVKILCQGIGLRLFARGGLSQVMKFFGGKHFLEGGFSVGDKVDAGHKAEPVRVALTLLLGSLTVRQHPAQGEKT